MSSRNYVDPVVEDRLWSELEQRSAELSASIASATAARAELAGAYADAYPWMEPGVVQSLVLAGVPPDDPAARQVGELAGEAAWEDGGFDESAADVPDGWLQSAWDALSGGVGTAVKGVTRGVFTALSAPFEELQALISSIGEAAFDDDPGFWGDMVSNYTEAAAPSNLRLAVGSLVSGRPVNLGSGFLPQQETRRQLEQRLTLDGFHVTPGRLVSRLVTEPGTRPYAAISGLVDFALNVAVPIDLGVGKLAKVGKLGQMSEVAGLVPATRRTLLSEVTRDQFLSSSVGRQLTRALTDMTDVRQVWDVTNRVDLGLARRLADTRTEGETLEVLRDALGTTLREAPVAGLGGRAAGAVADVLTRSRGSYGRVFGPGAVVKRSLSNVRLIHEVPGRVMNARDLDASAKTLHDFIRNAELGDEAASRYLYRLSDIQEGDSVALYNLTFDLMEEVTEKLVNQSGALRKRFTRSEASGLTRMVRNYYEDVRSYFIDELGRNADVLGGYTLIGDKVEDMRTVPHLMSELINDVVPLPDPRAIRRATSFIGRVWDIPGVKGSEAMADWLMSDIWKPMTLLRGAYTVRVVGEEQVRLAGVGLDSLVSHPVGWVEIAIGGSDSKLARMLDLIPGVDPKLTKDVTGRLFDELAEHQAALTRGSAGWRGLPGELVTGRFPRVRKGDPEFFQGAAVELTQLSTDPLARRVAGGLSEADLASIGRSLDDADPHDLSLIKEWWWRGGGASLREEFGKARGKASLVDDASAVAEGERLLGMGVVSNRWLGARDAADYHVDTVLRRVNLKTGQHPDLLELVGTQKLGDINIRGFDAGPKLAKKLAEYEDVLPAYVKAPEAIVVTHRGTVATQHMDRVVERLFHSLMSVPTNRLSRSPAFRQLYWKRVDELVGFATRETQDAILVAAKEAGLSRGALRKMAKKVSSGEGNRLVDIGEVDAIAKAFALDSTRELLYDLTKSNQFFDVMRLVFPFGEAWKEILTTWARIVKGNPAILRRFQQFVEGARDPEFGEFTSWALQTGSLPGEGFFHPDPQTGQEVFNYPGSAFLSRQVLDTDLAQVAFTGQVAGLNLLSASVLPGFGPMVQIPASVVLPKKSGAWEIVRDIVLPFGDPDMSQGVVESQLPGWFRKVFKGLAANPESDRIFANSVMDVARALVRSGEYSTRTPEEIDRLLLEAEKRARVLWVIRGVGQFGAPTSPAFTWSTEDLVGNVVPIKVLADEYRRLRDVKYQGDENAAFAEWMRRFGTENVLALQPKSRQIIQRPVTKEGATWLEQHPDLAHDYPLVAGLLAPEPPVGEFDYDTYLAQFEDRTREALTPAEMVAMSNNFLGRLAFEEAKRVVEGRNDPQAQLWITMVRDDIAREYPGFDSYVGLTPRPKTEQLIEELRAAVADPRFADLETVKATRLYLDAADTAEFLAQQIPGVKHYRSAKKARGLRDALRVTASEISARYPEFVRVWINVFSRELADDEVQMQ